MACLSSVIGAVLLLASVVRGINILMTNDDGFGSANLRETYRLLKAAGHNVYIVAPAYWQSGQGGRVEFTRHATLTKPSIYDLIPAGAPSIGTDPEDDHIWYYDGTPAACVLVALDHVLPRFGDFEVPDLLVSGPNFGLNLGPYVWTVSGTAGAAYTATYRGIPAMAFSATNKETPYLDVKDDANEATRAARLTVRLVHHFLNDTLSRGRTRILPLGYGLNINFPRLEADVDLSPPPVAQTRMTGGAEISRAEFSEAEGTFRRVRISPLAEGLNACVSGACWLPGETGTQAEGAVTVTVFSTDYDAPEGEAMKGIVGTLGALNRQRDRPDL